MSIEVTITIDGAELTDDQQIVVDLYEDLIETFIEKDTDYGNSYVRSAKVATLYEHGEVDEDELLEAISKQIFVRILDKQSRLYNLIFEQDTPLVDDENVEDTLLDLANYSVMLAAQIVNRQ